MKKMITTFLVGLAAAFLASCTETNYSRSNLEAQTLVKAEPASAKAKKKMTERQKAAQVKKSSNTKLSAGPSSIAGTYKVFGKRYYILKSSLNFKEQGIASWYGAQFHRRYTSSGERFNMYHMTAAHKSLPLSTYVMVTNLQNGRKVVVKINDRGPFVGKRIIDLSYGAAKKLGMVAAGTVPVKVEAIASRAS